MTVFVFRKRTKVFRGKGHLVLNLLPSNSGKQLYTHTHRERKRWEQQLNKVERIINTGELLVLFYREVWLHFLETPNAKSVSPIFHFCHQGF